MGYLIATALVWGILYALYHYSLRGETFYRANRLYLLGALGTGLILPLLPSIVVLVEPEDAVATVWLAPISASNNALQAALEAPFAWKKINDQLFLLWIVYGIGIGINGFRFFSGCFHLWKVVCRHGHFTDESGLEIVPVAGLVTPFSFFHYLFWDPSVYNTEQERRIIYAHEAAHARQWHSADVFLMELLTVFFWFNPFVYRYKYALRTLHELLADEAALRLTNTQYYGHLLIGQVQSGPVPALANHFFYSQLKERISKMTQPKSNRLQRWKYALAAPVVLLLFLFVNTLQLHAQSTPGYYVSDPTPQTFIAVDTVITFNPETYEEKMAIVKSELVGRPEQMPRYIGNGHCEDLALAERDDCSRKVFVEEVQQLLKENLPPALQNGQIKGKMLFKARIQDGQMTLFHEPIQGSISKEADKAVFQALNNLKGKWVNAKVKNREVAIEVLIPIVF
jgi:beta-lactamase regulating signal transducer with metallopeptidase domain